MNAEKSAATPSRIGCETERARAGEGGRPRVVDGDMCRATFVSARMRWCYGSSGVASEVVLLNTEAMIDELSR